MTTSHPRPIRYDLDRCRQDFLDRLDQIVSNLTSPDLQAALGQSLSQQLRAQERQIRHRLERPFSLVVVGEFKRGKSSLINALLGTPVVTTNVTPETVTINQIQYGESLRLEAQLTDGGWLQLDPDDLAADRLEPLLDSLPQRVHHLRIQTPVAWLQGISLVDTPGTGDIFKRFDTLVHDALAEADVVLFVVSALSPLSESERAFLQSAVLPRDFPKIFFVVNMMDAIRTDADADRLLASIQTKLCRLFPKARLFAVSAEDEICRLRSQPRPNPSRAPRLEANFQQFRQALQETIQFNRGVIQLDRAIAQLQRGLRELQAQVVLMRQALQANQAKLGAAIAQSEDDSSELATRVKAHQGSMQQEIDQLAVESCAWMEDFLQRFEAEAITHIPDFKLTDLRRHYHFFLMDTLRQAISQCLEAHYATLLERADQTLKAMASDYQQLTAVTLPNLPVAAATFKELPWTFLDTLELVSEFSPLKFVSGVLLNQAKGTKEIQQASRYQRQLQQAFPALRLAVNEQIQTLYQGIADQLIQHIEATYRQEVETCLASLRQAQALSQSGEQSTLATQTRLGQLLTGLTDTQDDLKTLQQKLWSGFTETVR
jgi:predicted GTPase